ncbi:MAG: hypothetical protein LPK45_09810, partial [Bacteroidota bacterium]|nr:hypothetical protein [Bacteroidota bacterium]
MQTEDSQSNPKRMKMTPYYVFSLLFGLLISSISFAQQGYVNETFEWKKKVIIGMDSSEVLAPFTSNSTVSSRTNIPVYTIQVPLEAGQIVEITGAPFYLFEEIPSEEYESLPHLMRVSDIKANTYPTIIKQHYATLRKKNIAIIEVPLYEASDNKISRLSHVTLKYKVSASPDFSLQGKKNVNWKDESLLKSGSWAKVIFAEDGLYRL